MRIAIRLVQYLTAYGILVMFCYTLRCAALRRRDHGQLGLLGAGAAGDLVRCGACVGVKGGGLMGTARMHTAIVTDRNGMVRRRLVVAVREVLPGHLVYNPPVTVRDGETLRFDPPLEFAIQRETVRPLDAAVQGDDEEDHR